MNTFNKLFSMCAILALGVGCADVSTESLESADRLEAAGHEVTFLDASEESVPEAKPAATCPDGWVDTSIIADGIESSCSIMLKKYLSAKDSGQIS